MVENTGVAEHPEAVKTKFEGTSASWRRRIAGSYHYRRITALRIQFGIVSHYSPHCLVWLVVIVTVPYI